MKKLIAIVIALAFVLSLAGTAFAADAFGDIADKTDAQKSAIAKLNALDIINGYPDGTFKPDNTITRAEFAKIAVITAGLEKSADVLMNSPSSFSDVKTGVWYTGYINLAATQGYVKGYPDGTFKPNAQISYAEVVTVLLRIAGYNDNLPGPWPVDYIAKAAALDITDDVAFSANTPATRADVAVMAGATLDTEVVSWDNDKEEFEKEDYTLLDDSFESAIIDDMKFTGWSYDADDEQFTVSFDAIDIDGDDQDETSAAVADLAQISGVSLVKDLGNRFADVIWDADEEEIAFIDVTSSSVVAKGSDIDEDGNDLEVNDDTYDVAAGYEVPEITGTTYYTVYLNEDDEVYLVKANSTPGTPEVVDEYDAEEEVLSTKQDTEYDLEDTDILVAKNGKWVTAAEIEENDIVYVNEDTNGVDFFVDVRSWKEGSFGQAYGSDATYSDVKVAGTKYAVAEEAAISRNGGEDFDYDFNADGVDNLGGETVKYFLNKAYQVAYIMCDVEASEDDELYGVVVGNTDKFVNEDGGKWINGSLTILLGDGTTVTYDLSADAEDADETFFENAGIDDFVVFTLDAAGDIEEIGDVALTVTDEITDVDETRNMLKIDGVWYEMTEDTVIFNTYYDEDNDDDEDAVVEKQSVIDEDVEGYTAAVKANSSDELEYIVFADEITTSSDDNYCLVTDSYYINGDLWVDVNVRGEDQSYEVDGDAGVVDGVYEYEFSGSKIQFGDAVDYNEGTNGTITDFSTTGSWVKIDDTKYFVDEDTYIFDMTADDPEYADLRAIDKGDDLGYIILTDDEDKNEDVIKFLFIVEAE